ncbi:CvpA family protein [Rhodobacterales bacterium FZCC0188]|jgi:membrane protein required for colicin V production|nr:CvpA family protein [Rhodobacterales bacterium FZCC0188]
MDGFTMIDGIAGGVIFISAILAYSRGFVREVMSILGWIAAAIVAYWAAPEVRPLISEIPYIGPYVDDSCELGMILGFSAAFAVTLIVVSLFSPLFSSFIQKTKLGGFDAGAGLFFGVLRGVALVAVALVAYDRLAGSDPAAAVVNSQTAQIFASLTTQIDSEIPSDAPGWLIGRYEGLTVGCVAPAAGDTQSARTLLSVPAA